MFRLTHYLRELIAPSPAVPRREPPGPVVIWNLVRRCNLACKHCYSISGDVDFPGELSTPDVFRVMDDLKAFRVPVLILSGGEPLMRLESPELLFDLRAALLQREQLLAQRRVVVHLGFRRGDRRLQRPLDAGDHQ